MEGSPRNKMNNHTKFSILQMNQFNCMHNGKTIFFSHMDFLEQTFSEISKLRNKVILISGNGDDGLNEKWASLCPENVEYWFAQNHLTPRKNSYSLPIGLDNDFVNENRVNHGIAWSHATEKKEMLSQIFCNDDTKPSNLIYANFNISTNPAHRNLVKSYCLKVDYINYKEPSLSYKEYISHMIDHEAVVCPAGNGIDTHRLWETLYCNRIPITIRLQNENDNGKYIPKQTEKYEIYKQLYSNLPIVILDSVDELLDKNHIESLIYEQKKKNFNRDMLNVCYWQDKITWLERTLKEI